MEDKVHFFIKKVEERKSKGFIKNPFIINTLKVITLIIFNVLMVQPLCIKSAPLDREESQLAYQMLKDLESYIGRFKAFSMSACDRFEQLLINLPGIAKKCPMARINYKRGSGFSVGYFTWLNSYCFFPYRIEEGFLPFLNSLQFESDKDFSFFISFYDQKNYHLAVRNFFGIVPILAGDRKKNFCKKLILMPDLFCLRKDYGEEVSKICETSSERPFHSRLDVAGFRGAPSGALYSMQSFGKVPRLDLVMLSHKHPDYIDARFSNRNDYQLERSKSGQQYKKFMTQIFGEESFYMPFHEMTKYRYNISLDGWVSAWKRPLHVMFTGSVPLFHTDYETYYSPYLIENVHYVSLKRDMSDILSKIDHLRENPALTQTIVEESQKFAHAVFTPRFHKQFMSVLFTAIAKKFND